MPLGTTLALLLGPLCLQWLGWRAWWWLLGGLSLLMAAGLAAVLARAVPPAARRPRAAGADLAAASWRASLRQTLAAPGPWLVAMIFALYSGQWLAVIGFLPTISAQAGLTGMFSGVFSGIFSGVLTALAAAANIGDRKSVV